MAVFGMVMKGILVLFCQRQKQNGGRTKLSVRKSGTYNTLKTSNKNIGML